MLSKSVSCTVSLLREVPDDTMSYSRCFGSSLLACAVFFLLYHVLVRRLHPSALLLLLSPSRRRSEQPVIIHSAPVPAVVVMDEKAPLLRPLIRLDVRDLGEAHDQERTVSGDI